MTGHYNPDFYKDFTLFDYKLDYLAAYNYAKGYKWMFYEYKNCVFSQVEQLVYYKKNTCADIVAFLEQESQSNVAKRCAAYFQEHEDEITPELTLLLDKKYEDVYALVAARIKAKLWKYKIKDFLNFIGR